jgi:hypothetical protein
MLPRQLDRAIRIRTVAGLTAAGHLAPDLLAAGHLTVGLLTQLHELYPLANNPLCNRFRRLRHCERHIPTCILPGLRQRYTTHSVPRPDAHARIAPD